MPIPSSSRGARRSLARHVIRGLTPAAVTLVAATLAAAALPRHAAAQRPVEIIGHRGAAGLAPENTLVAISRACAIGVDGIELDVHLTADTVLVVHHDYALHPDIARDPAGAWVPEDDRPLLRERTVAQLQAYDVGRLRPGADYTRRHPEQVPVDGERIPTLDEAITRFLAECPPPTRLVVEIKSDPTRPDLSFPPTLLADRTVEALRRRGVASRAQIIAFDWRPLRRVHAIAPEIPTSVLTVESRDFDTIERGAPGASPWLAGIDVDAHGGSVPRAIVAAGGRNWSPNARNVTAAVLAEAHALGLCVYPWTVNAEEDLRAMFALGVDGITTDRPDRLRALLERKGAATP